MFRIVFLAAGIALFVYLLGQLGPSRVFEALRGIGWGAVPIALTYAVFQLLRSFALTQAAAGGHTIRLADALWIRLSGEAIQFLTFTGPFLAEPTKALLLKRRGLSASEGFASTITEYLSYTLTGAMLSIAAIAWLLRQDSLPDGARAGAIAIICGMAAFLLAGAIAIRLRFHLLGTVLQWVAGLPGIRRRLRPNMKDVHRVEDLMLDVMHDRPRRFAWLLSIESAAHAVHIVELYVIMRALGLNASLLTATLIEGAAKFVGTAFFFVPAQVGASEAAHTVIFEVLALPAVAGFSVPFVRRIRSVAVAAFGLLALAALGGRRPTRPPI